MDFAKKIEDIRKYTKLNNSSLEKKLNLSNGYISNIEKKGTDNPGKLLVALVKLGISADWFLLDQGDMLLSTNRLTNQLNGITQSNSEKLTSQPAGIVLCNDDRLKNKPNDITQCNTERLKSYPVDISRCNDDRLENKPNDITQCNAERHTSMLENITNEMPRGQQIDMLPGEQSKQQINIQANIEELARQATASKFAEQEEKLETLRQDHESRIAALEQLLKQHGTSLETADSVKEPEPEYSAIYIEENDCIDLPLAENLAAGVPIEALYSGETYPVPSSYLKKNKRYCVAKINGTSMTDAGIQDGAFVLLQYTGQPMNGEIMVVTNDGYTTLKRLHQNKNGSWELRYEDGSNAKIEMIDGNWDVKGLFVRVLSV